ncbi:MAG: FAD-dependent oxidoreductase [Gemmatimonadales bacterium]
MSEPIRIAIVGAGPAGFFLAEKLLGQTETPVAVDLFDRLPTPYGLVRFGVAPDHEKIKSVTRSFDRTAARPGFRFLGAVDIGAALSVDELRRHYHALCFATGAQTDRRLGIPGEDLAGSHPATEFVAWYNGHPDFRDHQFDLSAERVAVIGVGNVAVDVARILCRTPEELARTDLADHALEALRESRVREVHLLGRRGPAQAAFTTPEVKELGELEGADLIISPEEAALDPLSQAALDAEGDKNTVRKVEVIQQAAGREPAGKPKRLFLRFLVSPTEILGDDQGRVRGLRLVRNQLVDRNGSLSARATEVTEEIPVGLVFRSVGYRGVALPGVPFDEKSGTVPNASGRVLDPAGAPIPGCYVAGWIKRGPSGVIGTNKPDAGETAAALLEDAAAGRLHAPGADPCDVLLAAKGIEPISWEEWLKLQQHENERGQADGRPRTKVIDLAEARASARGARL